MPKIGEPGAPAPGRKKGSVNRNTALLKDAILQAAEKAGDKKGVVGYLTQQAKENPVAFMGLLGKVMPLQVEGPEGKPLLAGLTVTIVDPRAG
jgi:hypothetical protein